MKNNFSLPAVAWILVTAICLLLILVGLKAGLKTTGWDKRRQQKIHFTTSLALSLWAGLLLVLSYKDFFADFSKLPPRPALAILIPLPFVLMIAFSRKGTELLKSIPAHWLVYMQSFRVIVELLLLSAFMTGKLPVQMTFEGRNFDVITGLLALPVGYLLAKRKPYVRRGAVAFNIIGLLLLLNILVVAVLSMPTPIRHFMNEPANILVAQFPFILLPGVLVPIAYALHIFSLRQLISEQTSPRQSDAMLTTAKIRAKTQPTNSSHSQHQTNAHVNLT
jgi:hypothetical protein